ncbi:hypothetical protein BJ912DRAFT_1043153 [Pholiota molesta]|nr:hypothetical protein BJ912DRAFT_1043153 [Pholiota molesta]
MSSPPALDFPSSEIGDVEMQDASTAAQSMPGVPLFLAGTPSTTAGTPRRRNEIPATSSPLRSMTARRAIGLTTPKRTPLFIGTLLEALLRWLFLPQLQQDLNKGPAQIPSDRPQDSDPLDFPSSPFRQNTPKNRRGDIHSSLSITPSASARRTAPRPSIGPNNLNSDASHLGLPQSSTANLSAAPAPSDEPDEIRAIWGTTVNLAETMKVFRDFFKGFKPKYRVMYDRERGLRTRAFSSPDEAEVVLYETYFRRMRQTGETNLNLDVTNLLAYPPSKKLHTQLVKYPQEVIPAMDQVLKDLMLEVADADQQAGVDGMQGDEGDEEIADIMGRVYKVRPFGLLSANMRTLNPSDTDKLVCIKGLVIRATPVIPDMKVAFFRCLTCSHTVQVEIDRGKIEEPARCPRDVCAFIGTMSLVHNRCEFADRQVIRLQETPDAVPDGQTPHTVSLSVYDELVDVSKPGDRIVVTGIYRSVPVRVNPRQRTLKSLFKTYLDVVHVTLGTSGTLGLDKSTRPAGGDRLPGVGGLGDGGDEDEEREGRQSRKAELEQKLQEWARSRTRESNICAAAGISPIADARAEVQLQRLEASCKIINGLNVAWKAQYSGKNWCYAPSHDSSDSVGIRRSDLYAANSKLYSRDRSGWRT